MEQNIIFKGKCVTVLGLGVHGGGIDTVRFLVARGARVTVTDLQSREDLRESIVRLGSAVEVVQFVLGEHRMEDFTAADMVIKTPGVPWNNPYVAAALAQDVPVYVDASLFFLLSDRLAIGVTGSKGKTTSAQMIVHFLEHGQKHPVPVGIGQTPVLGQLDALCDVSVPVCELSSWRLAGLGRVERSPHVAVVTNLLNDHGDYYADATAYEADKFQITRYQGPEDVLVLNADDARIVAWVNRTRARTVLCSTVQVPEGDAVFVRDSVVCERFGGVEAVLCAVDDMAVSGVHNQANMLAAIAAVRSMGVSVKDVRGAVRTFGGVAHRFEIVGMVDGVQYVNDTAATIPDAAIASIEACETAPVVIAGGSDKNLDFGVFADVLARRAKGVVLLSGTATEKMAVLLAAAGVEAPVVESMDAAVAATREMAAEGDTVLLSPGASSFGLFRNEFDRGDQFVAAVEKVGSELSRKRR